VWFPDRKIRRLRGRQTFSSSRRFSLASCVARRSCSPTDTPSWIPFSRFFTHKNLSSRLLSPNGLSLFVYLQRATKSGCGMYTLHCIWADELLQHGHGWVSVRVDRIHTPQISPAPLPPSSLALPLSSPFSPIVWQSSLPAFLAPSCRPCHACATSGGVHGVSVLRAQRRSVRSLEGARSLTLIAQSP
jgi:hypothetical protein